MLIADQRDAYSASFQIAAGYEDCNDCDDLPR